MIPPIELLTEKLNDHYAPLEWFYPELEGRGAAHPLVKSGLLTYARRSTTFRCEYACCDDPEREVIEEEDGSFTALCPGSAQPLKPTHEMLSVWRYNPERMAEILRGLLACEKVQEVNDETWSLGVSAHPALAGHRVYLQTRAATEPLEHARSAAPHAPYILLTGSARTLKESDLARQPTFTFAEVLSLSTTGKISLTPSAFATLTPPAPTATAGVQVACLMTEAMNQLKEVLHTKPAEKGYFSDRNLSILFDVSENTPYNWRKGKSKPPEGFHNALESQDYNAMQICAKKYRVNRAKCDVMNTKRVVHNLSDKVLSKMDRSY